MQLISFACKRVCVWVFMALLLSGSLFAIPAKNDRGEIDPPEDYVRQYLSQALHIPNPEDYDLRLKYEEIFKAQGIDHTNLTDENRTRIYNEFFSQYASPIIAKIFLGFTRPEYPNVLLHGQPGVGKTNTLHQLVMMYAFGFMPDYLREQLNLANPNSAAQADAKMFIKRTNLILVNSDLLSRSESINGQAAATTVERQKSTLIALHRAARREWSRTDKPGKRTIFVFEEAANLPPEVLQTLKTIQDNGAYDVRGNHSLRHSDPGFHTLLQTTTDEMHKMIGGDGAIDRRYLQVSIAEMPESEMMKLMRATANDIAEERRMMVVPDETLRYLVAMRGFLNWPPLNAPASIKMALGDVVQWKTQHPGRDPHEISRRDAQQFFIERFGLGPAWLEGINGEPPLHDLAEQVKKHVVGHERVIEEIAMIIRRWASFGIGKYVPVFILAGPSGTGKDTIFAAFNRVLFNQRGKDLIFDMSGRRGFGVDALLNGPNLGNHSDHRPSILLKALGNAGGTAMFALNEAGEFDEWDRLKVMLERGIIKPDGVDDRERPVRGPIFILGQWGEHLLENKTPEEQQKIVAQLSQNQIAAILAEGSPSGGEWTGKIPRAVLDRVTDRGGMFFLAPSADYAEIARTYLREFQLDRDQRDGLKIDIQQSVFEFVDRLVRERNRLDTERTSWFSRKLRLKVHPSGSRLVKSIFDDLTIGLLQFAKDELGDHLPDQLVISANIQVRSIRLAAGDGRVLVDIPAAQVLRGGGQCKETFF